MNHPYGPALRKKKFYRTSRVAIIAHYSFLVLMTVRHCAKLVFQKDEGSISWIKHSGFIHEEIFERSIAGEEISELLMRHPIVVPT
jgi:hypothetical protein